MWLIESYDFKTDGSISKSTGRRRYGWTPTPENIRFFKGLFRNLYRFFKQQIRWNKSAFREIFWNIPILHKHSLFMTVDLVYIICYPFFCITYLMYVLWKGTLLDLGMYFTIVCVLGVIKSIYGYILISFFYIFKNHSECFGQVFLKHASLVIFQHT